MSTYIIGDVQGCYTELQQLLELISYNPDNDRLAFVGDLVNRGPDSLAVLRFLRQLRNPWLVLGNHDLYLLILSYRLMPLNAYPHTLHAVIDAPDNNELMDWLRHQKLLWFDEATRTALVHAGIPPQWTVPESLDLAAEVETALRGDHFKAYLRRLFGDHPSAWQPTYTGQKRLRYITNALTRMRICTESGKLDFKTHHPHQIKNPLYKPWFEWRNPEEKEEKIDIFFGHWAVLGGKCDRPHCYATDTGCAWGQSLTAIRLEDKQSFSVPATTHATR